MLMTRITPKISASPSATIAYSAPARIPDTTTCPSIAGVMTTFTASRPPAGARRASRLALGPGRRRESRLRRRELVRPDGVLLAVLPLEQRHLVRQLEPVPVDLVIAEHRARHELQQCLAHLVGVEATGALDALGVDDAARVASRRVVRRLVAELFLIGVEELLLARVRQARLPLGRAVDVLGVLLERFVELRQDAADGDAVHARVDVQLLHLPGERHRVVEV